MGSMSEHTSTPRRAHIVTAHPDSSSLTLAVASRIASELQAQGIPTSIEDLSATGFDPRMTVGDLDTYRAALEGRIVAPPADVLAQQRLVEDAGALVLVFPVYWWSVPAQVKGWIDRVVTAGWAWGLTRTGRERSVFADRPVHLVALTASDQDHYVRDGYDVAMEAQLRHGVLEYCRTGDGRLHWLWDAEGQPAQALEQARSVAAEVRESLERRA